MSAEFIKKINATLKKDENLEDLEFVIEKFQLIKNKSLLRAIIKSKAKISNEHEELIKKYIKKAIIFNKIIKSYI